MADVPATPAQVDYALELLSQADYPSMVGVKHTELWAAAGIFKPYSKAFVGTPAVSWLKSLEKWQISKVIDRLKDEIADVPEDDD
jgi:hypothetical protein